MEELDQRHSLRTAFVDFAQAHRPVVARQLADAVGLWSEHPAAKPVVSGGGPRPWLPALTSSLLTRHF